MNVARRVIDAVAFVGFFAYLALVFAELGSLERPESTDSFSMYAVTATFWGARYGYDHRCSGRLVMLMWGLAGAAGMVALLAGLILITPVIGPYVRAQAWLPPVLIGVAVTFILVFVIGRVLGESTTEGRRIALEEVLAAGLIPFGIWLATLGERLLYAVGIVMALAGPILLWLLSQRRKQLRAMDERARP